MLYDSAEAFLGARRKAVFLFGMSGVGKTRIADLLRRAGTWFHYSVDYRIGTRYLGEHITDSIRRIAMRDPVLSRLLRSDSISLTSKMSFTNLTPLSEWVGAPGNPARNGVPFEEYVRRQRLHREAEVAATRDAGHFMHRAKEVYGYDDFVCDSSGSICEVADVENPRDPLMAHVAERMLPVYLRADAEHRDELLRRFDHAPKPMYHSELFLRRVWSAYLDGRAEEQADPAAFLRFAFARLLDWRTPRYERLADNWAVTLDSDRAAGLQSAAAFHDAVADAIDARRRGEAPPLRKAT